MDPLTSPSTVADGSGSSSRQDACTATEGGVGTWVRPPYPYYALSFVIVLAIGYLAAIRGLELRSEFWPATKHVRYPGDIAQAFAHGDRVFRLAQGDKTPIPEPKAIPWQVQKTEGLPAPTWREFYKGYVVSYQEIIDRARTNKLVKPTPRSMRRPFGLKPAEAEAPPEYEYGMDYPPLRLLTMALWVKHVRTAHPERTQWLAPRPRRHRRNEEMR